MEREQIDRERCLRTIRYFYDSVNYQRLQDATDAWTQAEAEGAFWQWWSWEDARQNRRNAALCLMLVHIDSLDPATAARVAALRADLQPEWSMIGHGIAPATGSSAPLGLRQGGDARRNWWIGLAGLWTILLVLRLTILKRRSVGAGKLRAEGRLE